MHVYACGACVHVCMHESLWEGLLLSRMICYKDVIKAQ